MAVCSSLGQLEGWQLLFFFFFFFFHFITITKRNINIPTLKLELHTLKNSKKLIEINKINQLINISLTTMLIITFHYYNLIF